MSIDKTIILMVMMVYSGSDELLYEIMNLWSTLGVTEPLQILLDIQLG